MQRRYPYTRQPMSPKPASFRRARPMSWAVWINAVFGGTAGTLMMFAAAVCLVR